MFSEWIVQLTTLATLEIVLGIDNLVFLAIVTSRLPEHQRASARRYGIALACISRILLLLSLSWLASMKAPLFSIGAQGFSVRDLVLIFGGLFLLVKAIMEISNEIKGAGGDPNARVVVGYWAAIAQIAVIDIVFSLDSVITAVGMVDNQVVMVLAILIAVAIMLLASNPVGEFIERNPTVKMLALAFLILVGVALMADGFGFHFSRNYLYLAMAFSASVEFLNMMVRRAHNSRVDGE